MAEMADGHFSRDTCRCSSTPAVNAMRHESRLCPRCVKVRATVLVNRKDPKTSKLWRIEVCPTCGFNYDLEEVAVKEAKLIEGAQPEEGPKPWSLWKPNY
jgi:hypothetical protein